MWIWSRIFHEETGWSDGFSAYIPGDPDSCLRALRRLGTPLCQNRVELIPLLTSIHRSFLLSKVTGIQLLLMCYRLSFITKLYALKMFIMLLAKNIDYCYYMFTIAQYILFCLLIYNIYRENNYGELTTKIFQVIFKSF